MVSKLVLSMPEIATGISPVRSGMGWFVNIRVRHGLVVSRKHRAYIRPVRSGCRAAIKPPVHTGDMAELLPDPAVVYMRLSWLDHGGRFL
jgi:hypothetical protein